MQITLLLEISVVKVFYFTAHGYNTSTYKGSSSKKIKLTFCRSGLLLTEMYLIFFLNICYAYQFIILNNLKYVKGIELIQKTDQKTENHCHWYWSQSENVTFKLFIRWFEIYLSGHISMELCYFCQKHKNKVHIECYNSKITPRMNLIICHLIKE